MLQRVVMEGLALPRLYIAENASDVALAKKNGIPFIRWKLGQDALIKYLLRPTIEKMFPGIDWLKVLGPKLKIRSKIEICKGSTSKSDNIICEEYNAEDMLEAQHKYDDIVDDITDCNMLDEDVVEGRTVKIAASERDIPADNSWLGDTFFETDKISVQEYIGDLSSNVDIDVLQKLSLLPKFVGDITDCIKLNLSNSMHWNEGYTKKLGYPLGNFKNKHELPNLIIIDISASIPDGIAATMIMLADTLRSQCNAELIITSRRSGYYPIGAELPKPQTLRNYYGRSNEGAEFMGILNNYIAGREFGHVISFGDDDNPGRSIRWYDSTAEFNLKLANTVVHEVHHYHTWASHKETGYARWVSECCPSVVKHFDTSWCNVMDDSYTMD